MTRRLILTRHAKSDWGTPGLRDFDRPLNKRGRTSATVVGAWLAEKGYRPDEVILSGAKRTVETWKGIEAAFDPAPPVRADGDLYDASAEAILAVLRRATAPVVMLIGHNPGFADFANRVAVAPPDHWRFRDYPTCATTVMRFPRDDWADVGWREADVIDFVVPRDLTGD